MFGKVHFLLLCTEVVGAFQGLLELAMGKETVRTSHCRTILVAAAAGLVDDGGAVRRAARSLLVNLASTIDQYSLITYMPTLSAHIGAAMTHTSSIVRIDTAETVAALAQVQPLAVSTATALVR